MAPGHRIVVSVPRMKLVEQTISAIREVVPRSRVGAWYGVKKEYKPIIVCCNASMATRAERIHCEGHQVDLWFCDEAHRSAATLTTLARADGIGHIQLHCSGTDVAFHVGPMTDILTVDPSPPLGDQGRHAQHHFRVRSRGRCGRGRAC